MILSDIKRGGFFRTVDGCFQIGDLTFDATKFKTENSPGQKVICFRAYGADFKVVVKDEFQWIRADAKVESLMPDGYRTVKTFETQ